MTFKTFLTGALALSMVPVAAGSASPDYQGAAEVSRRGLPPLDYDASLWNFDARWFTSEWNNSFSQLPWRYDHVTRRGGDLVLRLDSSGSAQIMTGSGTKPHNAGLWEADVTLAPYRSGVVQAPLWLYNGSTKDEIDFEFAGENGLFITMHTYTGGYKRHGVRLQNVQTGVRHRFGIKMDQAAGYVEMYVDGKMVHRFDKKTSPGFVSSPMNPIFELWAVHPNRQDFVEWVGRFGGISGGDKMEMTLHGHRYTAL
ncbi:family 16 glycosylhydrolase [uncultured Sphingomonas sp.]|uniref:family 16 glycosylhydrolase n=1 Tax=uncultured Sphingomonas sp. TaxID=158754 RepID=UPI0035CAB8D5